MTSISTVVTQLLLEAALFCFLRAVFKTMPSPSALQAYLQSNRTHIKNKASTLSFLAQQPNHKERNNKTRSLTQLNS